MKLKNAKDLDLKTRWFDNINSDDDIKVVNYIKDLDLKVFWFKKMLICLKRLRMLRTKELIIEFKFNEEETWLDLKFKILLCPLLLSYYALNSIFDIIIMIALSNRMLNDSKFNEIAQLWFVIINLASAAVMIIILL